MPTFVQTLVIENIAHGKDNFSDPCITFQIKGFSFTLLMNNVLEESFYPFSVVHTSSDSTNCPFCVDISRDPISECKTLTGHLSELFYYLIQHPSIRLHWLYIDYVEK